MNSFVDTLVRLPESLGRWLKLVLAMAENRGRLFSLELRQESEFLIKTLVAVLAALFLGAVSVIMFTFCAIFALDEKHRLAGMIVFAVAYAVISVIIAMIVKKRLRQRPLPFSQSLEELEKDRRTLGGS